MPRRKKAACAADARDFVDIPNVGPSIAADLCRLGLVRPADLAGADPHALYLNLCRLTNARQDPCVLDVLMAAVDFMSGGPPRPWWHFTAERKRRHPEPHPG